MLGRVVLALYRIVLVLSRVVIVLSRVVLLLSCVVSCCARGQVCRSGVVSFCFVLLLVLLFRIDLKKAFKTRKSKRTRFYSLENFTGALSGLRLFLVTENPLKMI